MYGRPFLSAERHALEPTQRLLCCVPGLIVGQQGSRSSTSTTRHHLKYHWWDLCHWLRNTGLTYNNLDPGQYKQKYTCTMGPSHPVLPVFPIAFPGGFHRYPHSFSWWLGDLPEWGGSHTGLKYKKRIYENQMGAPCKSSSICTSAIKFSRHQMSLLPSIVCKLSQVLENMI